MTRLWHLFAGFPTAWEAKRQAKRGTVWGKFWLKFNKNFAFIPSFCSRQVSRWSECELLKSLRTHKCSKLAPWVPGLVFSDRNQTNYLVWSQCALFILLIGLIIADAQGPRGSTCQGANLRILQWEVESDINLNCESSINHANGLFIALKCVKSQTRPPFWNTFNAAYGHWTLVHVFYIGNTKISSSQPNSSAMVMAMSIYILCLSGFCRESHAYIMKEKIPWRYILSVAKPYLPLCILFICFAKIARIVNDLQCHSV